MTEQQQLFEAPAAPRLTKLQQNALAFVQEAGWDGVQAWELGAKVHEDNGKHSSAEPCRFCKHEGRRLLERLKKDGLVNYKRPRGGHGFWRAADAEQAAPAGMTDTIPF